MVPVVQQLLCVVWLPVDSGQSEAALETTRQQLIRELIATEETYCRDLDVILDVSIVLLKYMHCRFSLYMYIVHVLVHVRIWCL